MKRSVNFYERMHGDFQRKSQNLEMRQKIQIGKVIRQFRDSLRMTGAELCRRSGGMDPRTLTAIEKGRIQNPSLQSLQQIAQGLGCLVRDFFTQGEMALARNFHRSTQKGVFQMDFPKLGLKVVSSTPPTANLFCGKVIFAPKRILEGSLFGHPRSLFIEVVMGRVECVVEGGVTVLKEGESIFFNGALAHTLRNLLSRETSVLLVSAPSFLSRS